MKTLKKILSLVLVVAMLASMMIVGAAAAEEKTNYEEAVAVVTGIGIIEGDENGMNYQGNVTREQAAKIIAYLLLGKDTAEALKTSTAPFADVAATRWSAGYIAYLKGQGIISGVSDTEFDPTANVTGIAFAKMLLVAAGYGANGEFEGKDWDINTITFANDNGVFTGTKAADVAAPATREEAMLYAFNVLTKVPTVKYNKTFESYYTGKSALDPIVGDVLPNETDASAPYAYTLAWTKYALKQVTGADTDDFGRPAASWVADGQYVAESVANIAPDYTLYGSVNSASLYSTLGKTVIKNLNDTMEYAGTVSADYVTVFTPYDYYTNDNITVWVDGREQVDFEWEEIVSGEYKNYVSGTGATVELYLDYDVIDNVGTYSLDIVVWYEYIGDISKVDATNDIITIDGDYTWEGVAGYAKKDTVIYTIGFAIDATNGVVTSVRSADATVGTVTGKDWMGYWQVDGVSTSISAVNDSVDLEIGVSYEFYYNSLGSVLRADVYDAAGATGAYQYLYVIDAESQVSVVDTLLDTQDAKVLLNVVYPEGGQAVVSYALKYSSKLDDYYITVDGVDYLVGDNELTNIDVDDAVAQPISDILGGWMTYTKNDAGDVTLKALNGTYADVNTEAISAKTAAANVTGISGYIANSQTVLTKVDEDGSILSYTGIANFPTGVLSDTAGHVVYTYAKDSKVLKTITVYVGDNELTSNLDLAYCAFLWSEDANGFTYMFYVDGAAQFITFEEELSGTGKVFDLDLVGGEYEANEVVAYSGVGTEGMVNNGYTIHGTGFWSATCFGNGSNYASFSLDTYTYTYYEHATVDTIDENYFTTVACDEDTVCTSCANTYYFDNNTVIYDVTGGGATELSEGDVFCAYINDVDGSTTFDAGYVQYIWIVG